MSTPNTLPEIARKAVARAYSSVRDELTGTSDYDSQILHDAAIGWAIDQTDEPAVDISDAVIEAAYDRLAQS